MAFSAFLILFETRSNTFFNDEHFFFERLGQGINAESILEPHNGHLIAPAHLIYAVVFAGVGPNYTVFRAIGVLVLLGCCLLLFQLIRRRVGALLALAPTVVLLFLGSSWEALLWPLTMVTFALSLAWGLAALLALERGDPKGDVAACVLTSLSVISHSTGLAFLVAVAVAVLLGADRRRRSWIFLLPLAIYAGWWLWALKFHEGVVQLANVLLTPAFIAESLAANAAAVTGLGINLDQGPGTLTVTSSWGQVIGLIATVAIIVRLSRGGVRRSLWVSLVALLAYWTALALAFGPARSPESSRYLFPGAALLLLVAAEAVGGRQLPRSGVIAIFVVSVASVLTNIRQLDDAEQFLRDNAPLARATLGAIEVARGSVSANFTPSQVAQPRAAAGQRLPIRAGPYLHAVDRFGSYAFSPSDLLRQDREVQADADRVLGAAERLSLRSAAGHQRAGHCTHVLGGGATRAVRQLRPGQLLLEAEQRAGVRLGRFDPGYPVALGTLTPRRPMTLSIPRDAAARPWRIAVSSSAPVTLCIHKTVDITS